MEEGRRSIKDNNNLTSVDSHSLRVAVPPTNTNTKTGAATNPPQIGGRKYINAVAGIAAIAAQRVIRNT